MAFCCLLQRFIGNKPHISLLEEIFWPSKEKKGVIRHKNSDHNPLRLSFEHIIRIYSTRFFFLPLCCILIPKYQILFLSRLCRHKYRCQKIFFFISSHYFLFPPFPTDDVLLFLKVSFFLKFHSFWRVSSAHLSHQRVLTSELSVVYQ